MSRNDAREPFRVQIIYLLSGPKKWPLNVAIFFLVAVIGKLVAEIFFTDFTCGSVRNFFNKQPQKPIGAGRIGQTRLPQQ